jgi:hypothetical protein
MNGRKRATPACLLLAALVALSGPAGCVSSDERQFRKAVERVKAGESDTVDARAFPNITDKALADLDEAVGLQTLLLDDAAITDEGLRPLALLPQLKTVSVSHTRLTDAALEPLTAARGLEVLRLDRTAVKDPGMRLVGALPNLKELSLWKCFITDRGLAPLARLKKLERLSLDETLITNAGLKHLSGLTRLKYLSLWKTKVTDAGVRDLKQSLPSVQINR